MIRFMPDTHGLALSEFNFDISSIPCLCVMTTSRSCIEIKIENVGSNHFSNTSDQMAVKRELAAGEDAFQTLGRFIQCIEVSSDFLPIDGFIHPQGLPRSQVTS